MNYRHAYHAGNFADVVKHAILALILRHLRQKPAAFRVIDTHAGIGLYDLESEKATKTGEWRDGIGRLEARLPAEAEALLSPYREAVEAVRLVHGPMAYPGSPLIALHGMRREDRAILVEKHPRDWPRLRDAIGRDRRAKALELDGWTALNAMIPPPERRGLVLVDPPYERPDEFTHLAEALARAWAKWPTGIYALWYPIKDPRDVDAFCRTIAADGIRKVLRLEVNVDADGGPDRLNGTGMVVVNPPWRLAEEAAILLPALAQRLARGPRAAWRADWIAGD